MSRRLAVLALTQQNEKTVASRFPVQLIGLRRSNADSSEPNGKGEDEDNERENNCTSKA